MKIRFLTRQVFRTGRPGGDTIYEEGRVYDLREDQARRWLRRDVAVFVTEEEEGEAQLPEAPSKPAKPSRTVSSSEGPSHEPEDRALRGTDFDDPGVDTSRPDAMTTADIQTAQQGPSDGLDNMLREDLLELVKERGMDLGSGYHARKDIIAALRAQSDN